MTVKIAINFQSLPIRQRLALDVGQFVQHEGLTYRIVQQIDFNSLLGSDVITGRKKLLPINELIPTKSAVANWIPALTDGIEDQDWRAANERSEAEPVNQFYWTRRG